MIAVSRGRDLDCDRHRLALLGLLEDPLGAELQTDARSHLDRCDRCRRELADMVLTGLAVRRTMVEAAVAVPDPGAWARLRGRLEREGSQPRVGRAASSIASVALAAGLAIALLVPPLVQPLSGDRIVHEAGVDPAAIQEAGNRDAAEELASLRATILAGKEAASKDDVNSARERLIRAEVQSERDPWTPSRNPFGAEAR